MYRFSTKYNDQETDLYYYGYRYYLSDIGRWVNRDPLYIKNPKENNSSLSSTDDDPNIYLFQYNDGLNNQDKLGMFTINSALLEEFKALNSDYSNSKHNRKKFEEWIKTKTYQERFDIWYKWEQTNQQWWKTSRLPKCPKQLCLVYTKCSASGEYQERIVNPDSSAWKDPKPIDKPHVERFHPGAVYEMRSLPVNGHSNQCTYDQAGFVITTPPAMGTVDFVAPRWGHRSEHWYNDVATVIFAAKLDGKWSGAIGDDPYIFGSLTGVFVPSTAGRLTGTGPNMQKYYNVRPTYAEE